MMCTPSVHVITTAFLLSQTPNQLSQMILGLLEVFFSPANQGFCSPLLPRVLRLQDLFDFWNSL